ncbi:uncharacterized protein LOC112188420 isoform X2 [Rosa chinensis]|uniref:uncharacterized protein LOC112188420 isoform X2 n=1 Tax=Rosa chinensis TaxID=74649 RepID=UPI000D090CED|nr:uncharacterized protein LOC112188420 isoform X2 [Rosa chinensis]
MTTMDVKGINWVGCVYEKFESMCLEVEENMYQDTVKFVEDQVQTVGESVKKFYADIMQDLLCDSSLDGDNISACGFPIEHYSDVDNSKKSKIRKTKEHVKVGVEEVNGDSEVISVVEKNVEHTGLFHRQRVYDSCTRSSGDCAKVACSDLYSRQDHGMRSYINKNLVVKQTPIKDRLPGANTAVGKDFNRVSLSCSEFSNENHDASCDQPDEVITPTVEGMRCDSMRERCVVANASQCTDDVSINCQSSDLIVLDKSDGKRWNELLESSIGGSNISSVHGTEISQQSDKAKLEETCVMVSGEELHFVHHMVANCKPYKKKIPKAFTSRTSSARKQEYEQLALWHGHHTKAFLGGEDSKKSPTRDICESEWEIL